MDNKKTFIIQESAFSAETSITKNNSNTIEFIAVLQEADRPNRNGRIYPKSVLEKAIDSPYIRERIATKSLYGEAGHPLDSSVQRQMTIDQRNIACIIKEIWWEGNLLKGRVETADTAVGRDMMGLIKQGSKVAFSLRAQGNVHTNPATGIVEVEPGLQICTWDWVCNPSHDRAFLEKICEATAKCMFGMAKPSEMVLTESADMFVNGAIIDCDAKDKMPEIDYTKDYTTKLKKYVDMYVPAPSDEVVSMDLKETVIKSGDVNKRVLTEDFIVKDIRSRLVAEKAEKPVLDLSESWKAEYDSFLTEAEEDETNLISNLEEATNEVKQGYAVIDEYFNLFEAAPGRGAPDGRPASSGSNITINTNSNSMEALQQSLAGILAKGATDIFGKQYDLNGKKYTYSPEATYTAQSITDMKFPENVIFFVKQVLVWIKNVVLYFIEKILNLIRRITGTGTEIQLDPKMLKLNLTKEKEISTYAQTVSLGGRPKVSSNKKIKAYIINSEDLGTYSPMDLSEGIIDDLAKSAGIVKPEDKLKEKLVVTVDFSDDLITLQELIQHFYDLFDHAYGSNGEKLFGTEDIEAVLRLFKKIMDSINDGAPMTNYTLGGGAAEVSVLNADRIRDNLILTNSNIRSLKEVFTETSNRVSDISKIINSKEMLLLADSGVDYKLLTASTTNQMERIIKTVNPRLKAATKLEKSLRKMQTEYGKINSKLNDMSSKLRTYGNISYSTYYSRQITEMSNSAKYMTDIVTLRLTAVALYIQELKSIRNCLEMLTGLQGQKLLRR